MPTEAEKAIYPLSDPNGESIPYSIGDPQGLFIVSVANGAASAEKELPSDWEIVTIWSTVDAIIAFGDAVALDVTEDVEKENHLILPSKAPVSIRVPEIKKFKTWGLGAAGKIYIQRFRRWQALSVESRQTGI